MHAGRMSLCCFALLGVLAGAGRAGAEPVDELVLATMQRERVPGVALLVMRSGTVLRAAGYGLANVEHHVPVRRDTMFQSGSLGKQFTAAAVLMLAERGRIALADRVSGYLPPPPPAWAPITVRQLLDHTSGIHDSEDGAVFDLRREYSDDEIIQIAYSYPLDFPPGSRWKYNNMGYVLAGIILTRLTGAPYGEFLRREIFDPLGMRTARIISDTAIVPHRAAGYVRTAQGIRNQDFVSASLNATGDGSLYLSLDDWAGWIAAMDRGALLSGASWKALWERSVLNDGRTTDHGLCFDHVVLAGHAVLEFDGSWQGFRSAIERDPSTSVTVVVLENLAEAEPVPLARAVLTRLDPPAPR